MCCNAVRGGEINISSLECQEWEVIGLAPGLVAKVKPSSMISCIRDG